jgi:hypothetical protein
MCVMDGVHRVRAARLRGERSIEAVFFDGDAEAAFVQAVEPVARTIGAITAKV